MPVADEEDREEEPEAEGVVPVPVAGLAFDIEANGDGIAQGFPTPLAGPPEPEAGEDDEGEGGVCDGDEPVADGAAGEVGVEICHPTHEGAEADGTGAKHFSGVPVDEGGAAVSADQSNWHAGVGGPFGVLQRGRSLTARFGEDHLGG